MRNHSSPTNRSKGLPWCLAVTLALCTALPVRGQWQPSSLMPGLSALYDRALEVDATYAAARAAYDADAQGSRLAAAAFSPSVTLSASLEQSQTQTEELPSTKRLANNYTPLGWTLRLSKPIYSQDRQGFRTENEIRAARAESVLEQARQDLLLRLLQSVFNFLLAQDQLALSRAQAEAVAAQLAQVQAMLPSRSATRTDVADARARHEVAKAQIGLAESQLEVRRLELARLVGWPLPAELVPMTSNPVVPSPDPADPQLWIDKARRSSPKVEAMEWNVRLAEAAITRAKASTQPSLSLIASTQRTLAPNPFSAWERNSTIALQFNMTLYDGGTSPAQVDQAGFQRERARNELESTRQEVGILAGQAYWGVVHGVRQVSALEEAVKAAELSLEGTRLGIQANIKTFADELNAVQLLYTARRDLQRERYTLLFSAIQLQTYTGVALPEVQAVAGTSKLKP